jgi:hypothetical protein
VKRRGLMRVMQKTQEHERRLRAEQKRNARAAPRARRRALGAARCLVTPPRAS